MDTGTPPPSRPVVSAGSGQNDHLSEIISHILEPIIKMRPGGLEVTSTGDLISVVEGINRMVIPLEDINLEEVDYHLDTQEKEAQEKYDRFDEEMAQEEYRKDDNNLPDGWKLENRRENINFTDGQNLPNGWKMKAGNKGEGSTLANKVKHSRRVESCQDEKMSLEEITGGLEKRWKGTEYRIVLKR